MNRYTLHTVATLLSLLAGSAQAAELIVNGGFEAAPPAPGGTILYAGASGPPGWTHVGGTVWTLDTGYAEDPTVFQAHGGQVSMDLTGPGNTGPTSGLRQAVPTMAGQLYNLSFRNATGLADSQTGLDDISLLAAVPEPGTWVLMLAGIGALMLRRQGVPAAPQRVA